MAWESGVRILCLLLAVGQANGEAAKTVSGALDELCNIFKESVTMDYTDKEKVKGLLDKVKMSFADEIDCSMNPYDPIAGYNEHGKTFEQCMEIDSKAYGKLTETEGGYKIAAIDCIENIADEKTKTGAIWVHQKWSVAGETFESRAAGRFSFDENMKVNAFHQISDLLPAYKRFDEKSRLYSMIDDVQPPSFPDMFSISLGALIGTGVLISVSISHRFAILRVADRAQPQRSLSLQAVSEELALE